MPELKVGTHIFPEGVEAGSLEAAVIEGEAKSVLEILSEGRTVDTAVRIASHAAERADTLIDRIAEPEDLPRRACKKGCAYCCYLVNVITAIPEVLAIARGLTEHTEPDELDAVRRRIENYLERVKGLDYEASGGIRYPCPLLVDDLCLAYEARPLACRGWNSLDVSKCEEDFRHPEFKSATPVCKPQFDIATNVRLGIYVGLRFAGFQQDRVDLVGGLRIALDSPAAVVRWLDGGPFLDADQSA